MFAFLTNMEEEYGGGKNGQADVLPFRSFCHVDVGSRCGC